MNNKKLITETSVFLLLIAVTFFIIFKDSNFAGSISVIKNSDMKYIIISAIVMILYVFCGGLCIKIIFSNMNQKMSIKRCVKYSFIEFFFSALTPSSTGGQPMQIVSMKRDGYNAADSTVALVVIALIYRLTLFVFAIVFFIIDFNFAMKYASEVKYIFYIGLILNIIFSLFLFVVLFSQNFINKSATFVLKILCKLRIKSEKKYLLYCERIDNYTAKYNKCAQFMLSHRKLVVESSLILLLQRLAILSVPYFAYKALGMNELDFLEIVGIQLMLSICVDIMPFPGSVGISETVFLHLYGSVFGTMIIPAVMISRGISFYFVFIVSAFVVNLVFIKKLFKRKNNIPEWRNNL